MIIALIGASGSGKSTIENALTEYGYKKIIPHTTRQPRDGEINGKDYHFISNPTFENMLDSDLFAEYDEYSQSRFYGTLKSDYLEGDKVVVLTPNGLRQLKKNCQVENIFTVLVEASLGTRVKRYIDRCGVDKFDFDDKNEISARVERDFGAFMGVENEVDMIVYNNDDMSVDDVTKSILNACKEKNKSKEKPKLFVDFDGTCVNTIKAICKTYHQDFKWYKNYKIIPWTEINTWDFTELNCTTPEYINTYFNQERFFNYLEYFDWAKETLEELNRDWDITIVSSGFSPNLRIKEEWVKKHLPFCKFIGVNLKEYKDKSHVDMSGKETVFIDDSAHNLITSNADLKICFGDIYPWNENWDGKRCANWEDVKNVLDKRREKTTD